MKKLIFIIVLLSLLGSRAWAQLDSVYFTSFPCYAFVGGTGIITVNYDSNATYYEWELVTGHVNAIWFNGSPGPAQTNVPSVNVAFQLQLQYYIVCVTAYSVCCTSNTFCDTLWGTIAEPVLSSSNSTIAVPGDSGTYAVDTPATGCGAASYMWTITGDATFNNGNQVTGTTSTNVNINFAPGFTSGLLCVRAISPVGLATDTVCMTIYAPASIIDDSGPKVTIYYQPGPEQIALTLSNAMNQRIAIKIYDIMGRVVNMQEHMVASGKGQIFIDTQSLYHGVYSVDVTCPGFRKIFKFAKTK